MLFVQRKHGPGPCELVRNPHRRKRFLTWFPYVILLLGVGLRLAEAEVETNNGGSHGFKVPSGTSERVSSPGPVGMLLVWNYQVLKLANLLCYSSFIQFQGPGRSGTELAPDPVRTLLLASTLDGSLTGIGRLSGNIRWVSKDEPLIRVPPSGHNNENLKPPIFLPDPRSGSLYVSGGPGQLKKLQFTIPQLVGMAPCRSSEGLLYTGRKVKY
jgi:hypothetical protein